MLVALNDDVEVGLGEAVERRLQFRDGGTLLALERVQVGPARTEVAVGGDQLLDAERALAADVGIGAAGLCTTLVVPCLARSAKALTTGGVGDVAGVGAVDGRDVLQRVEIRAPVVGHRCRVVEVGLVQLFDIGRIAAEEVRVALVGAVDGRTRRRGNRS